MTTKAHSSTTNSTTPPRPRFWLARMLATSSASLSAKPGASTHTIHSGGPLALGDQNWRIAKGLARTLTRICGASYSHTTPNLTAIRREAIKTGHGWPSYHELLTTQTFFLDDFQADLVKSCQLLLKYQPFTYRRLKTLKLDASRATVLEHIASNLFTQIRALSLNPDLDILRSLPQFLAQWKHNIPSSHWNIFSQQEVYGRLEFYLACAWSKPAQANVAAICLQEAYRQQDPAATKLTFLSALGWLRLAGSEISHTLRHNKVLDGIAVAIEGNSVSQPVLHRISKIPTLDLLSGEAAFEPRDATPSREGAAPNKQPRPEPKSK